MLGTRDTAIAHTLVPSCNGACPSGWKRPTVIWWPCRHHVCLLISSRTIGLTLLADLHSLDDALIGRGRTAQTMIGVAFLRFWL